jgi:hypothetical protein
MILVIPFTTFATIWIVLFVLAIPEARAIAFTVFAIGALAFVFVILSRRSSIRLERDTAATSYSKRREELISEAKTRLLPLLAGTGAEIEIDPLEASDTLYSEPNTHLERKRKVPSRRPIRLSYVAEPPADIPPDMLARRQPNALDEVVIHVAINPGRSMVGPAFVGEDGATKDDGQIDVLEWRRFQDGSESGYQIWPRIHWGAARRLATPQDAISMLVDYVRSDRIVGPNTVKWRP